MFIKFTILILVCCSCNHIGASLVPDVTFATSGAYAGDGFAPSFFCGPVHKCFVGRMDGSSLYSVFAFNTNGGSETTGFRIEAPGNGNADYSVSGGAAPDFCGGTQANSLFIVQGDLNVLDRDDLMSLRVDASGTATWTTLIEDVPSQIEGPETLRMLISNDASFVVMITYTAATTYIYQLKLADQSLMLVTQIVAEWQTAYLSPTDDYLLLLIAYSPSVFELTSVGVKASFATTKKVNGVLQGGEDVNPLVLFVGDNKVVYAISQYMGGTRSEVNVYDAVAAPDVLDFFVSAVTNEGQLIGYNLTTGDVVVFTDDGSAAPLLIGEATDCHANMIVVNADYAFCRTQTDNYVLRMKLDGSEAPVQSTFSVYDHFGKKPLMVVSDYVFVYAANDKSGVYAVPPDDLAATPLLVMDLTGLGTGPYSETSIAGNFFFFSLYPVPYAAELPASFLPPTTTPLTTQTATTTDDSGTSVSSGTMASDMATTATDGSGAASTSASVSDSASLCASPFVLLVSSVLFFAYN